MATIKYTDIEIQTAKNLLKEGYKWLYRSGFGTLYAYQAKPLINEANYDVHYDLLCKYYVPIFQSVKSCDEPVSLESIVHPPILDDAEKRYLKGVIRPFRNDVEKIYKISGGKDRERIAFYGKSYFFLPDFDAGTMYGGMEYDRRYTLEELGL